jgi:hypothetical protein
MAGNDSYTKVLLQFDGSDASTTITDVAFGATPATWTAAGNAQLDTSIVKFGTAALLLDGTGDEITASDSANFDYGSGDWTVDFWFNRAGGDGANRFIFGQGDSGIANGLSVFANLTTGNVMRGVVTADGSTQVTVTGTTTYTATGWHHCAFVRTGNTLKLFLDGVQEGGDVAFSSTVHNSTNTMAIGGTGAATTLLWNGSLDEFRISIGIARWTTGFTPPTEAYSIDGITGTLTKTLANVTSSSEADLEIFGTTSKTLANATSSSEADLEIFGTVSKTLANVTPSSVADLEILGISQTLVSATLASTGTLLISGTTSKTLDNATLSADGDTGGEGDLSVTLADVLASGAGKIDISGSLTQTLGSVASSSAADMETFGSLSQTLGNCTLEVKVFDNMYLNKPNLISNATSYQNLTQRPW